MSMIYGEQVRLRAAEREDVKHYYAWVNDPEVTHGLSLYLPMSNVEEEHWFERSLQRDPNEKPLAIEVRDGDGWKLIGNCGVFGIEWVNSSGELGIMIGDKSAWNQGYGTEAMTLLLRHCFQTLNLNRVCLKVYADNPRAIRAYEKAGFVEEGRMREAVFKHGKYDDIILMSVLRSEWTARMKEKQS
ncbi:MAG: GNAT family N-acetyltransferase [Chloroflexi bacterium]|nr:GNAT family N-acetyltransferase [Chloroflexota bacterium]